MATLNNENYRHFMYSDEVMMALLLYTKPIHGPADPHGLLCNSISSQAMLRANLELQKTKASCKHGSYT